jgi:hypothetical protein
MEGADIFEFGIGLQDVMIPLFSRSVGLSADGVQVPLDIGGKVNGRVRNTNLGAMIVRTRAVDDAGIGAATMGAARVKENIFAESSVGLIATVGDQQGHSGSWMTGGDFTYSTSRFRGDKNLMIGGWALASRRGDLDDDGRAFGFGVLYPNDRWDFSLTSARLGEDFDPSLGFVPRTDVHIWQGEFAFKPRPQRAGIRQMFHDTSFFLANSLDGGWESYEWSLNPFDWLLESGDRFSADFRRLGDRPEEDFDVFESDQSVVLIPAGSHEWHRYQLEAVAAPKRVVSGEVKFEAGGFYGGTLRTVETLVAFQHSLFKLEFGAERNIGSAAGWSSLTVVDDETEEEAAGGRFTQSLYSTRVEMKISPELQVSSFVQYDNESTSLGTNTRVRWTFHPQGDLFVVYNHNLHRSLGELHRRNFEFESNALVVKFQYAWRP